MKTRLLPHSFKNIGWILLLPSSIIGLYLIIFGTQSINFELPVFSFIVLDFFEDGSWFSISKTNIFPTLIGSIFLIGALLVTFSQEKQEDELIALLRLNALMWAVGFNYILLLISFLIVYDFAFLYVMMFNMFTVLIIFIIRFQYLLFLHFKVLPDDK